MQANDTPPLHDLIFRWNAALDEALIAVGVDPAAIVAGPLNSVVRIAEGAFVDLVGDGDETLIVDARDVDPRAGLLIEDGPSHALRTGEPTPLDTVAISVETGRERELVALIEGFSTLRLPGSVRNIAVRGDFLSGALRKSGVDVGERLSI